MNKRLFSLILSVIMLISLIPAEALGLDTETESGYPEELDVDPVVPTGAAGAIGYGTCEDGLFWELTEDGTLTVSGSGEMADYGWKLIKGTTEFRTDAPWGDYIGSVRRLVIGSGVTGIGSSAFYNCDALTETDIADTVTSIGESAFGNCDGLVSLTVPGSVTELGFSAFCWCIYLESVVIEGDVKALPESAFAFCYSLSEVTLPEGLESIGSSAFTDCISLQTITLPENVRSIGDDGFNNCASLTEISFSGNMQTVGKRAFNACTSLSDIRFSGSEKQWNAIDIDEENNEALGTAQKHFAVLDCGSCGDGLSWKLDNDYTLTVYGSGDMADRGSLVNGAGQVVTDGAWGAYSECVRTIVIDEGVTAVGKNAFCGFTALTGLSLPQGLSGIGDGAFYGCTALKALVVPDGTVSIGESAFEGCTALAGLYIPDSVLTLSADAFKDCSSVREVYTDTQNPQWRASCLNNGNAALSYSSVTLYTKLKYMGRCGDTACWFTDYDRLYVLGSGSTWDYCWGDAPWTEGYREKMNTLRVGEGMERIGSCAFYDMGSFNVYLPESLETVGEWAFASCSNGYIVLGSGIRTMGQGAFSGQSGIGGALKYGGDLASWMQIDFADPDANPARYRPVWISGTQPSGKLVIPEGVTEIKPCCFENWDGITTLYIPSSVTEIGEYAFSGCGSLRTVSMAEGLVSIGEGAFDECVSLTDAAFPTTLKTVGSTAFHCTALTAVYLPAGLTSLGAGAFGGCDGLTEIVLPEGLEAIESYMFSWSENLGKVTIPAGITRVEAGAFGGCTALKEVYYTGTKEQYAGISIEDDNAPLKGARVYCSQTMPHVHTLVITQEYTVNCEQEGVSQGKYCASCGTVFQEAVITPPTGHEWICNISGRDSETGLALISARCNRCGMEDTVLGSTITVSGSDAKLNAGRSITLTAEFTPENVTGADIVWSIVGEGNDEAVTIKPEGSTCTVTAKKDADYYDCIYIRASASDGLSIPAEVSVELLPKTTALYICGYDGEYERDITGRTETINLNAEARLQLTASWEPWNACPGVTWVSSNEKVATVDKNGLVTACTTGKVKITAKANDGSGKSAGITVNVVRAATEINILNAPEYMQSGKSITLRTDVQYDTTLTDKTLSWSMDLLSAALGSVKNGRFSSKPVYEPTVVTVYAYNDYAFDYAEIVLLPTATGAQIYCGERLTENNELLHADIGETLNLTGGCWPENSYDDGKLKWKSSNKKVATVNEAGQVTGVGAGTATITYTYSGRSVGVKINVGKPVTDISFTSAVSELRSGRSHSFKAAVNADASVSKLSWSLVNGEDTAWCTLSGSGRLTAKTVYEPHEVVIAAAATDGTGVKETFTVTIRPKSDDMLIFRSMGEVLNGMTLPMEVGESLELEVTNALGEPESVTLRTSGGLSLGGASANTVNALKKGSCTVTAVSADGKRSARLSIKVTVRVSRIDIGVKKDAPARVASGKSLSLTAATNPDASTKKVTWALKYPSDGRYASISSSGSLKAAGGLTGRRTVYVVARATDGSRCESEPFAVELYPVTTAVSILENGINVTGVSVRLPVGSGTTVSAKTYPSEAMDAVTWKSSSPSVARINEYGEITGYKKGKVTFTATAADGSGKSARITIEFK